MFDIAIVYESGKRYIIPLEKFEDLIDEDTADKIKTRALKEVQKL